MTRQPKSQWMFATLLLWSSALGLLSPSPASLLAEEPAPGTERVVFEDDQKQPQTVEGQILTEAQDGGLLLLGRDGRIWTVLPEQLKSRIDLEMPFAPYTAAELGERLKAEMGAGFEVTVTEHYVICSNTPAPYTTWCGKLFERLFKAFHAHWKQREVALQAPVFPLVAIVLADEQQFGKFATTDAGPAAATAKGYFSIPKNRMVLYDLTATGRGPAATDQEIEKRLEAVPLNTATVVHEATHQIAFNSGLHVRYADNPLWLTEGMAMYFETPDLRNRTGTGWRTAGAINRPRVRQFRDYLTRRPPDSLATLLGTDARFTTQETAADAYAEAWALSYFLIQTKPREYTAYLKDIAALPRLEFGGPEVRLEKFRAVFGEDLEKLDTQFLRYMKRFQRIQ